MTGRRGVRQMSLFEVLIILNWVQRREMWRFMMMCRWSRYYRLYYSGVVIPPGNVVDGAHEKLEDLLEGKPVVIIEDGERPGRNSITPT